MYRGVETRCNQSPARVHEELLIAGETQQKNIFMEMIAGCSVVLHYGTYNSSMKYDAMRS